MTKCVYVVLVVLVVGASLANAAPWRFCHFGDPQIGMSDGLGGDNGWAYDIQRFRTAVQQATGELAAHIAIAGDLVNQWDNGTQLDGFFQVYPSAFTQKASLVPGNHDVDNTASAIDTLTQLDHYRTTFERDDYTFEIVHNVMFVNINSATLIHVDPNADVVAEAEKQWSFIEEKLQMAESMPEIDHVFMVMHHPPFLEDEFEYDPDSIYSWPPVPRLRLLSLARRYGVRNLLCGHTHTTETIRPRDFAFTIYTVGGTARFFDQNGFGYRIWEVDGPFLSQRYERLAVELQTFEACRDEPAGAVSSHPYFCRMHVPKAD